MVRVAAVVVPAVHGRNIAVNKSLRSQCFFEDAGSFICTVDIFAL